MKRLPLEKQTLLIASLLEGTSVRGAARVAKITFPTALRNLVWLGDVCQNYHDEHVRNLSCESVQADEMWNLLYGREKNLSAATVGKIEAGDIWVWIALDPVSRLVICWHVGKRDASDAQRFADDLASRIEGRTQISTDKLRAYSSAIESAFGDRADYATISKKSAKGETEKTTDGQFKRPQKMDAMKAAARFGNPDPELITTNSIEGMNLHFRMGIGRCARSSNKISKKLENHRAALALYFLYYNYGRVQEGIRCTPAMEAGISDHIWELEEIANLVVKKPHGKGGRKKASLSEDS